MLNRLKSTNYTALKGTLLKSKEIRNSLNFAEASKQKESLFHYWYETVHMEEDMKLYLDTEEKKQHCGLD